MKENFSPFSLDLKHQFLRNENSTVVMATDAEHPKSSAVDEVFHYMFFLE
jgi:hypothetical protein